MKSITTLLTSLLMLALVMACDTKKQQDSVEVAEKANDEAFDDQDNREKDADFVVKTVAANYGEVRLAQLAQNRSRDERIKSAAKQIETDHSKIISDLKSYASKNQITIPTEETNDDKEDIKTLSEVKDGNEFDEKWCKLLKDRHESTIDKFESRLDQSEDMELKNWISSTLPTLHKHLDSISESKARVN